MAVKDVLVPDLGCTDGVDVIEFAVKAGDSVEKEDTLLVLESDKATVEVPSPFSGKLVGFNVSEGQSVKEGDKLAEIDVSEESGATQTKKDDSPPNKPASKDKPAANKASTSQAKESSAKPASDRIETISVPDIGGGEGVDVIEVNVQEGDSLEKEQTMIVLESDKATMEVPAPKAGTVRKVLLSVGDKVSQGDKVLELMVSDEGESEPAKPEQPHQQPEPEQASVSKAAPSQSQTAAKAQPQVQDTQPSKRVHAGPAVRRLARELGVDLAEVKASGPKARILKEDVHHYVNHRLTTSSGASGGSGDGLPPLPEVDFSKWGEIEAVELNKINKLTATNLHRAWVHIPHVTQFDEADITDLEAFRKAEAAHLQDPEVKLTLLAFLVQACAKALHTFPRFNSSLSTDGQKLIYKKYINIGIAVDTPNGLVVPVIRDADKKSVIEIAQAMKDLSGKARAKKLSPADMQGGSFSISSLGGVGGTAFTPIVNWPEVAILGVSRSQMKPVYIGGGFQPRLILPLSLSYDHRVIDGADAARFTSYLSQQLADIRRLLL